MAAVDPSPVASGHDVTSTPGHEKLNDTTEQKQSDELTLSEKERQDKAAHTIQVSHCKIVLAVASHRVPSMGESRSRDSKTVPGLI